MGDSRATASEVRCVAPLVTLGDKPALVGPCTIVTNGERAIAFSSAELLRHAAEPLVIYTRLDGSSSIPVKSWQLGLRGGMGLIEIPPGTAFSTEVYPLNLTSVYATLDTRGAPTGLVSFGAAFERRVIGVHLDNADPTGEDPLWLATAASTDDDGAGVDGAPLFAWMPPDPVLGRPSEVVVVALAVTYRQGKHAPRKRVPLAVVVGLDDLSRALPWAEQTPPPRTELEQVAGEIGEPPRAK
ncbi:MAG TPA: hypothetical protein VGL61_11840 [Kofleriaceae bacterium]